MWSTFWASLFSFSGRINRGTFIAHTVAGFMLTGVLIVALVIAMAGLPNAALHRAMLMLALFTGLNQLSLTSRRLHDCGFNGVGSVCILIPGFNLVLLSIILFMPGQRHPNKYGLPTGIGAYDLLRQGRHFESRAKWQEAFRCYAGVVESERFSEMEEDVALDAIARLKERLEEAGVRSF